MQLSPPTFTCHSLFEPESWAMSAAHTPPRAEEMVSPVLTPALVKRLSVSSPPVAVGLLIHRSSALTLNPMPHGPAAPVVGKLEITSPALGMTGPWGGAYPPSARALRSFWLLTGTRSGLSSNRGRRDGAP